MVAGLVLGCSPDGGPTGPEGNSARGYHLILLDGDTLQGRAGDTLQAIRVLVVGPDGLPASGTQLRFRVLEGGGGLLRGSGETDGSGVAVASWILGPNLTRPQVLRARVVRGDTAFIYAKAGLPTGAQLDADTTLTAIDTIGSTVATSLQVRVRLPDGHQRGRLHQLAIGGFRGQPDSCGINSRTAQRTGPRAHLPRHRSPGCTGGARDSGGYPAL
jgi:hypothetical protein